MSHRQRRLVELRNSHFTPLESRQLSILPKSTPALKLLKEDRQARWARFEKIAAYKIASGKWRRGQIGAKWLKNISRMYTKHGWRVKEGPRGKQQPMAKGSPNAFAMYRDYERRVGGPGTNRHVSPGELGKTKSGKALLNRGLLYVQKARSEGRPPLASHAKYWIDQLNEKINTTTGSQREQLIKQKNNLERSLH